MSTAISPPGGPSAAGAADVSAGSDVESSTSADGAAALNRASAAGAADALTPAVAAQQVESPTGALLSRLDAGEITRAQAIESLLAEAIAAHGVSQLPAAQREELEGILRAALLDDPTLARLLG